MELNYFISNNFLFAEADQEYWNHSETSATLKNNCEINLFSEFRFRDDMENHYNFLGFGIRKKINSWISISESYKHIFFKKENNYYLFTKKNINFIFYNIRNFITKIH